MRSISFNKIFIKKITTVTIFPNPLNKLHITANNNTIRHKTPNQPL